MSIKATIKKALSGLTAFGGQVLGVLKQNDFVEGFKSEAGNKQLEAAFKGRTSSEYEHFRKLQEEYDRQALQKEAEELLAKGERPKL